MNLSETIELHLPYLRRYARAVTGSAARGDVAVESTLEVLLAGMPDAVSRVSLFHSLDKGLCAIAASDELGQAMSSPSRRALLLTAMEGFTAADAANILGVPDAAFSELLLSAETDLAQVSQSRICIIEDEPLIAASLAQIVTALGHTVTGITATHADAVAHALAETPDLILADIELADGSQGTAAVAQIRATLRIPAIFITAFPERMLAGRKGEPAFLIPKPFKPAHVKAVITQALLLGRPSVY